MILQQAMLPAELAVAESAIAHYALRRLATVLVRAADLLGRHAAAQGGGEVQRRLGLDALA
jgi:hypothetical protein